MVYQKREHIQETKNRATDLYFKIERQYALTGQALTVRDINRLVGRRSSASAQMYVNILIHRGWIKHEARTVRTIVPIPLFPVGYNIEGEIKCVK